MQKQDCKVGMPVLFGRENGERTAGVIVKLNFVNAVVKTLEARGKHKAGANWRVPYAVLESVDGKKPATPQETPSKPLTYNPFQASGDEHILRAIVCCYGELSPENLCCDGELPLGRVRQKRQALNRKLKSLFDALGRVVSETEAWDWELSRQAYAQGRTALPVAKETD